MQSKKKRLLLCGVAGGALTLVIVAAVVAQRHHRAAAMPPDPRLGKVLALGSLQTLDGEVKTYFTPGYAPAAHSVQDLITRERQYFAKELGVDVPLALAVLDQNDWAKVESDLPYGLPSVSDPPCVALMPADWKTTNIGFFPDPGTLPADRLAQLHSGADGIGAHELGHRVYVAYEIDPQTRWLHELLAQYLATAFFRANDPKRLADWRAFTEQGLGYPHPHVSLDEFEALGDELASKAPANYAWYEMMFEKRAEKLLDEDGLGFVKKVRTAFPAPSSKPMKSAEVIEALDRISSGWAAWAQTLQHGG